jgi:hypothetical protein
MSIVAQSRRPLMSNLRIAIWSSFLLVLVLPLLLRNAGHPYYGAIVLRPGSWVLSRLSPGLASDRGVVLLNFVLYCIVIYVLLRVFRADRRPQ